MFFKFKIIEKLLEIVNVTRLNGQTILYVENDMMEHIEVDTIISDFSSKNARRNCLVYLF
jgi:hypothetical protein